MFPGQGPAFLDNRMTTVKRVFRRILPALIPVDPTENRTPEQRFQELLEILRASANSRLWLAFLLDPSPGPEVSAGSSLDLAAWTIGGEELDAAVSADILQDELRPPGLLAGDAPAGFPRRSAERRRAARATRSAAAGPGRDSRRCPRSTSGPG